jgi:DNA-binding MarR family transcriptional regulator
MSDPATATISGDGARSSDRDPAPERNPHKEAWVALVQAHAALTGRVQEALAGADFPPLPWFEVLSTLADAPEERMKMGDLAEALVITRGGLTKLVDRLIKAGLLERTFCETDRRVSYATLLPAGREMLEEMRPVVVTELRASFSSRLTVEEADAMRRSLERVRSAACSLGE